MGVNIVSQFQYSTFNSTHPAAWSLCYSWATCYYTCWISPVPQASCIYNCDWTKSEVAKPSLIELEPNPNCEAGQTKPNPNYNNDRTEQNPNLRYWVRFLSLACEGVFVGV